ncbi:cytochrome P450 [Ascidiaceihabitans sp.]|uniref:cytochrome P450 n=1 Tax=Ascidiaceihabitans sp. TaxID=1872644 RepID=UPI003299C8B8
MVAVFTNVFTTAFRIIQVVLEAFLALGWLILNGAKAAMGGGIAAFATSAAAQRRVFAILRAFVPNFTLNKVLMKAYDNTGTAVVSRRVDVLDVLNRNDDFEVVYGTRMRKLTEGENFFLGMQPGWDYTRDTSAMRLAARMDDVPNIVLPRATERADDIVKASGGKIDIVPALTLEVPWDMTATYFGAGGEREAMQAWTTDLFWYLFEDLPADPKLDAKAMKFAGALRSYLDTLIQDRKANPTDAEDILNRCLALQSADTPGMSDLGIRNNMLGILIGAIPTISKACCLALDELLNRPDALATAHKAALAGDDALLAMHIWEALRFNPHNPVIYRRATRDAVVGRSTLRQRTIKKGQIVFAGTASAQFDRYDIPTPNQFRTDRPFEDYIIWGYGMHNCFGAAINAAVIPAILKPLLAQKNLRRAAGAAGQIDGGGTPHPQHFHVEFDT